MGRFALIGYGAIGARIAGLVAAHAPQAQLAAIVLRAESPRAAALQAAGRPVVADTAALLAAAPDVVLECAGHAALAAHGPAVLASGRNLIVASIGALADPALAAALHEAAALGGGRLLLPAGAVGGLDALAAMRLAGDIRVVYRSRKPPEAWRGTKAEALVDLAGLVEAETFYRGSARAAARDYPKNANVAATIALSGMGLDATEVELIADPAVAANIHELSAKGPTGTLFLRLEGVPDPANPKTSMLTAFSLARMLLDRLTGPKQG